MHIRRKNEEYAKAMKAEAERAAMAAHEVLKIVVDALQQSDSANRID